jgi:hypothetical protein
VRSIDAGTAAPDRQLAGRGRPRRVPVPTAWRNPAMTTDAARRLAEHVHAGLADRYGEPMLDHVGRVAAAVPPEARAVAWLHEVFECTPLGTDELRAAGATPVEIEAVRLLTRSGDADAAEYEEHVLRIAKAPGRSGALARIVKRADLRDRLEHPGGPVASTVARPAYRDALRILDAAGERS